MRKTNTHTRIHTDRPKSIRAGHSSLVRTAHVNVLMTVHNYGTQQSKEKL